MASSKLISSLSKNAGKKKKIFSVVEAPYFDIFRSVILPAWTCIPSDLF